MDLDDSLMRAATKWMIEDSGVTPAFGPLPEGLEASRRIRRGRTVFILLNHSAHAVHLPLPRAIGSLRIAGADVTSVDLPVQGVDVIEDAR